MLPERSVGPSSADRAEVAQQYRQLYPQLQGTQQQQTQENPQVRPEELRGQQLLQQNVQKLPQMSEQQRLRTVRTDEPRGPPENLLSTFDAFAFDAPKSPQRTPEKNVVAGKRGGVVARSTRGNTTPVLKGSSSSRKSNNNNNGCSCDCSGTKTSMVSGVSSSSCYSCTRTYELQAESELSPGVRLSLEWLAEAERRRSLSSSEVAASFRCPLCHQFGMEFRSGRYGMFLGCSRYPTCRGKVSGSKVEKWRCCTGNSNSSNGVRIFCEFETPHAFRLHAAGCTETGEMLTTALPRIIDTAAKAYARHQRQDQQQQKQDSLSIPGFLRPLSWLPRSDRIKSDESVRLQFSSAAALHASAAEGCSEHEWESYGTSATVPAAPTGSTSKLGALWKRQGFRFKDWTEGAVESPKDGLKYTDGCVFRLSAYPYILQAAAAVCGWATLTPIPSLTLRFFKEAWGPGKFLVTSKEIALRVAWWLLPSRLRQHLLPFQWEGVAYGLQRGGRALIGDEMGLGKTVQAISCIAVYKQFPCLIVVPASMRLAWADALEEWLPEYSGPPQLRVLFASGDRPSPDEKHLICLSSFEMAARLYDTLKATQYKFVVVDEAHKLRGPAIPRPAPYTSSEVAAATAAAAVAGTTGTPHDATIKAAEEQLVESEAAPADAATSVKSMYFSTHERQREQKHRQQKEQQSSGCAGNSKGRVLRGRKICKPQGSGHEVNKKVLDLVRSSRHALLLSGTPSVKLPADLFPLVDALLPPLEQQDAADRRHQQLQQWNELVVSAAKAAAVAAGAVAACSRVSATDAKDLLVEEIGVENTKATAEPASCALVRSPWFEATEAWRTASAAAATTRSFAATGALPETYGQPLGSSAGATSEICDKSSLVSFTERAQERRRVGNILREERLQFAEEYCCSSRAFGSWRRFGASLRSWELHLLLTRAVLVRRRKTLRDTLRMPPEVTSQRPSQVAPQAASPRMSSQASAEAALQGLPEGTLNTQLGAQDMLGEMKAGTPPPPSASAGIFFHRVSSSNTETEPAAARAGDEQIASPLEPTDLLLFVQEAENTVEGIPWVSKAPEDCDALVLPPCTRIMHLLQLHCNNKLVAAMAEGLLLRKPAYKSLIRIEERKTAVTSRSSSGDSDYGFGTADFHTSSGVAGVAAQLLQQPPATPAERAGLCKVLPAAEWLLEKFFRDASVSWLDDAEEAPTKVVVFAHHRRVLDALAARLRELRMGCLNTSEQGLSGIRKRQAFVRIDGSVPEEERNRRRRLFLSDPACNLAIISISASSHGLDFSGASVCVFLELLPQQHELLQAESRLHRRGQRRLVTTYFLLSRCGPSAAATCGVSTSARASALARSSVSGISNSETELECDEANMKSSAEQQDDLQSPLTTPFSSYRSSRQTLQKTRTPCKSFRKELKKCVMQLLREAEATEEAAWHRIRQQSALVQRTIDGPLAKLSHFEETQQPQQEEGQYPQCRRQMVPRLERVGHSLTADGEQQQQEQRQNPSHHQVQEQEGLMATGLNFSTDSIPQEASVDSVTANSSNVSLSSLPQPLQRPQCLLESLSGPPGPSDVAKRIRFRVSKYTQRLHAFTNATSSPLGVSFSRAELVNSRTIYCPTEQKQDQHQLLPQQQGRLGDCTNDYAMKCAREAARQYMELFRLLSSFEQRRVREMALTVRDLHVYLQSRHRIQQKCGGIADSEVGFDKADVGRRGNESPQQQEGVLVTATLLPRHTTDPLLLLQSAAQQQEHQRVRDPASIQGSGDGIFSERIVETSPRCRSSVASCNARRGSAESSGMASEIDNDPERDIVSSRYFCRQMGKSLPKKIFRRDGRNQSGSARLPGETASSGVNAGICSRVVLVPVILSTNKTAGIASQSGGVYRHLQPFSVELKKVLCVSCMKPISAVSTTRTFLQVRELEDFNKSSGKSVSLSQPQPGGAHAGIAGSESISADERNNRERLQSSQFTCSQHAPPQTARSYTETSRLQTGVETVTAPQNFAIDGRQHWLIRCSEQDLTCCGRCADAYSARRRRRALRRQVERHDGGVCSQCGLDCGELLIALRMLHAAGEPQWRLEEEIVRLAPSFRPWPTLIRRLASVLTASCAWEADHRQPVVEGGGLATVDAVQTLCKACHLEKTLEERRRRRKRRMVHTTDT